MAADEPTIPRTPGAVARQGRRFGALPILSGTLTALLCLAGLYALLAEGGHGGEPVAVATIEEPGNDTAPVDTPGALRATLDDDPGQSPPAGEFEVAPADIVIRAPAELVQAAAPEGAHESHVTEMSSHGPVPAISPDGARAADVHGGTVPPGAADMPRIAVLIGGMGLSTRLTEDAIRRLPGAVSLAFAPYGREVARLAANARQEGHEILLQVPLEPYDYPDNDPGPHTLLTGLSDAQNRDRLHWIMSRFTGYAGVVNYMGGRFSANTDTLRPLLGELRQRGLVYADDSSAPGSVAGDVARDIGLPFAAADVMIDADRSRAGIRAALDELVDIALSEGQAFGVASGLPASVEEIADWAPFVEEKGAVLVPVTAVVSGGET